MFSEPKYPKNNIFNFEKGSTAPRGLAIRAGRYLLQIGWHKSACWRSLHVIVLHCCCPRHCHSHTGPLMAAPVSNRAVPSLLDPLAWMWISGWGCDVLRLLLVMFNVPFPRRVLSWRLLHWLSFSRCIGVVTWRMVYSFAFNNRSTDLSVLPFCFDVPKLMNALMQCVTAHVQYSTSASFLAELSVWSPRKLIIFII